MLNSTTLEVAIGLVFCFASVALIVSSIHEAIASMLKLRSKSLLEGVKTLLNDPSVEGLALNLYNHALVNPHADGTAKNQQDLKNLPSYIEPKQFAIALIDSIQKIPGDFAQLGTDIDALKDPQLRQLLKDKYARADGSIEKIHAELATWFDTGMDRLTGDYKRNSQIYCFIIAFLVAALFNIDAFHLFTTLWQHPNLAAGINASIPTDYWQGLKTLPIGWPDSGISHITAIQVLGWLVTASSTLFGAPFWFDILQQLIRLRGAGNKPGSTGKQASN